MNVLACTVCVWTLIATAFGSTQNSNVRCYSCINIRTSEECMNVTTCTGGEGCYGRADGMPNGEVLHTLGCTRDSEAVVDVRAFCSEMCLDNLCNLNICHLPVSSKGSPDRPPRCLSCDLISSPTLCTNIVQCQNNQICYAREVTVYGHRRYRMGCIDKQHCSDSPKTQGLTSPQLVGKRSLNSSCSLCCGEDHCNALSCNDQQHHSHLKLLGNSSSCVDSNPIACTSFGSLNSEACTILPNVDLMCPKTCGICGHFGWSPWSNWSSCSTTCNDGMRQRSRICIHQIDQSHLHNCPGPAKETMSCSLDICSVEGQWTDWESWGECSRTCNNGTKVRIRQCSSASLQPGGLYCPGDRLEETECQGKPCDEETSCPDEWTAYHNSCYYCGHVGAIFSYSQNFCHHREATLVHIESEDENRFIINHLLTFKNPGSGWWLGMTKQYSLWYWTSSNIRVNYTNWYQSEGSTSREDCAILFPSYNFSMADIACNENSPYALCEKHR